MGADLGHQEGFVAPPLETFAEPVLGLAAAILPATVIEGDAAVQSRMNKFDRGLFVLGDTDVMSARTESRDLNFCLAEASERDSISSFHITLMPNCIDSLRISCTENLAAAAQPPGQPQTEH
jgi:hypothetical protein